MAKNLADLRRMPRGQLEKVKKEDIIESILAANGNDDGALGRVEARLDKLIVENGALRQAFTVFEEANNRKIQEMQIKFDKQAEIIMKQQMFLEGIDRKERENNLVVLGVPEDSDTFEEATNDNDKLGKIWTTIGTDVTRVTHRRLGRFAQAGKKRPILVVVISKENRDGVLENSKKLKDAGSSYERVYVKKDLHPAVRKEWNRLREAERNEKSRPENQNVTIRFDSRERKLYRNDTVIDSWNPHPF